MKTQLLTNRLSNELKLILDILNVRPDQLDIDSYKIDWNLFAEMAIHHRIHTLLYPKLKKIKEIPKPILRELEVHYRRNSFDMLHLCGEMKKLSELLLKDKIRVLFLKGPVLAIDLYGDLSLRTSSDIDILVPLADLQKVERHLEEKGFVKDDYITSILNDWKWRHHHVNFVHHETGTKVEVHWRLNPGPAKEPDFKELWNRRRKSTLTEYPIYYLGREDLFMFLITHGARHGWSRLRWLIDINQMLKQEIDWTVLLPLLKSFNYSRICGKTIILANLLLNTQIPDASKRLISDKAFKLSESTFFYFERMVNLHTPPLPEEVEKYHASYLFSIKSWKHKLLFLLSCLHPYPKDKEIINLPLTMHFLYIPLRPLIWALRKSRRVA